jgi:parvulin-like peptidyl-prolyl isomerase
LPRVSFTLLAVLVVLLAAACGSSSGGVPSGAAAVVGDREISKDRLDGLLNQAELVYKKTKRPFPKEGSIGFTALRGRALAYLVVGEMYQAHAADEDITATDAEIDAQVEKTKQATYGKTAAEQEKTMKEEGMTEDELRAESELKVIQNKIQAKVWKGVSVSDADVTKFYEDNKNRFTIPASRVIRTILLDNKKLADRLRSMVRAGSDFAALAKQYSKDRPTGRLGGRVIVSQGQLTPAVDKVAFSIGTGQISEVIPTQYGYQFLQAVAPVHPAVVTPLSRVSKAIRRQLLQNAREEALGSWQIDAKNEFCTDSKIKYAKGFRPRPDDNPCRDEGPVTPASG